METKEDTTTRVETDEICTLSGALNIRPGHLSKYIAYAHPIRSLEGQPNDLHRAEPVEVGLVLKVRIR